jgi:hypothetical protein
MEATNYVNFINGKSFLYNSVLSSQGADVTCVDTASGYLFQGTNYIVFKCTNALANCPLRFDTTFSSANTIIKSGTGIALTLLVLLLIL